MPSLADEDMPITPSSGNDRCKAQPALPTDRRLLKRLRLGALGGDLSDFFLDEYTV